MACRLYVLTVLIETITDIAIEADLYIQLKNVSGDANSRIRAYLTVFGFAQYVVSSCWTVW